MQTTLNLGHLCVAKPGAGRVLCSYPVYDPAHPGKPIEMRVICKAVEQREGKAIKRAVVLRMEPMLLKNYELVNGQIKPGDALYINATDWKCEIEHSPWMQRVYFLITTDTLSRAPTPAEAKEQKTTTVRAQSAQGATN